jgi:predicted PurR-regulated permease PerM
MAGAWGVLAFALNYLPYIGSLTVTALLPLFAFVHLEPAFSGSALSISPPVDLFSIVLWTFLWGALGAFLGVPLSIAALTVYEHFPSTQWIADLLSGGRRIGASTPEPS